MNPRQTLRAMLQNDICPAPGAYDAWSAKLVEQAGFPAVYMTGYGVSASVLGKPDIGLITMTEMVAMAANMAEAVNIPVIADADTGYGSVLNAMRIAREYEKAGVAAIQIEDQVFPKRCGHMEGKAVIPAEDMAAKIRGMVAARADPDFLIIARTDARAVLGFEEAVARSLLYLEAGADVIFFEAPTSVEEMRTAVARIGAPMLANMVNRGKTPFLSLSELRDIGFRLVIYPVVPLYAATRAVMRALDVLRSEGDVASIQGDMVDFPAFNKAIHLDELRALEASFAEKP